MAQRDPIDTASVLRAGAALWERNAGRLWRNIDATERVLMAYVHPAAAWRAADSLLAEPGRTQRA